MDTSMGTTLNPFLKDDEFSLTVEIKINFIKPIIKGEMVCESTVISRGKTLAVIKCEIFNEEKLCSYGIGTFAINKIKGEENIAKLKK
jgi:acyl-CoA thioesterase